MKTNRLIKLLAGLGIIAMTTGAFASFVPTPATTQLTIQNNTSGGVSINRGALGFNNIAGNAFTSSPLPSGKLSAYWRGTATQDQTGQDYDVSFPINFPNNNGVCVVKIHYNSNNQAINIDTDTSKLNTSAASCTHIISMPGDQNKLMVLLKTK
jgi:hypothetical protein